MIITQMTFAPESDQEAAALRGAVLKAHHNARIRGVTIEYTGPAMTCHVYDVDRHVAEELTKMFAEIT